MASKSGTTALQTALQGGKISDKAAQSALGQAVGRIANLTKRAQHSREAMMETGAQVLHTAETHGTLFLASMAEGYLGEDKLRLGAVDLRGPLALVAQGWGLYQTMSGQRGAGSHVLAVGNGLMGSWLASVARNAGQTLADKRSGAAALPAPAPAPMPVAMQGMPGLLPEPGLAGPMREVLLTPQTDGEELGRGGRRRKLRRQMRKRMKRRMDRRQSDSEPESDEELEGDFDGEGFGRRRGRRRGRFVRADDDDDDLE